MDGFYEVDVSALPVVTWLVENPDSSTTSYNTLRISEIRDSSTRVYEYIWNGGLGTWTLMKGNGLEILTKSEETVAGDRVVTETEKDGSGYVISKVQTTYHEITCDSETREEIIELIEDPDGSALTTSIIYYEEPCSVGSCGKIASQVNPDGSWVRYEYDDQGRKTSEIKSWLDGPEGAAAGASHAVYYDYTSQDALDSEALEDVRLPRMVTEEILGNIAARTCYLYQHNENDRTEIVERFVDPSACFGNPGNLRTTKTYHRLDTPFPESGQIKQILYPDGRMDSHTYEYGTYSPNANPESPGFFTPGSGKDVRETITHGTDASPDGIAGKTTREVMIKDETDHLLLQETHVYTGTGYERIGWTVQIHDDLGHVIEKNHSNGTRIESFWGCCNKEFEIDIQGIPRHYSYDDLNRIVTQIKEADTGDITTTYIHGADSSGRNTTMTVTSGSLSLSTISRYDIAGRLYSTTDKNGLVTRYDHSSHGLVTTVTRPGGITEISARYMDGKTKSVTGTGVIAKFYEYGVNPDSSRWTTIHTGTPESSCWEKRTTDMSGRTIKIEHPGYSGVKTTENYYNIKGYLERTATDGMADTLYEYDEVGNQIQTGLDLDSNGLLDADSNDRITRNLEGYTFIDDNWWQETTQQVYPTEFNSTPKTTLLNRTKLTGLGPGGKVEESVSLDVNGNMTVTRVLIDRENKTLTRIIDYPDSANNEISFSVNGLVSYSRDKSGKTTTYGYDALERRVSVTDPRTGSLITHYNSKDQVDYVEDPAGNRTSYAYDPDTGRKLTETNALNRVTRFGYNNRGDVTHTWGESPYPVKYVYDDLFGNLKEMYTYRNGTGWDGETWPSAPGTPDVTIWHYQDSTGLLESREDAAQGMIFYTYCADGKVQTRRWSRLDNDDPIVTTYGYDPDTGELISIDYSDATPDIAFTYDRLGRHKTITDGVGTRTFVYNNGLQLESEIITGLYNKTITRTYESGLNSFVGRATGFTTGSDYNITYGYDDTTGRPDSVGWSVEGQTQTAAYSYLPESDLLYQKTVGNGQRTTYSYEPHRNLATRIKNEYNDGVISQYDYVYDELDRRSSVLPLEMPLQGRHLTCTTIMTEAS